MDSLAPMTFYNIKIVKEFVHESHGKRYYVTHGDIFDAVTTRMKWLAQLGGVGYDFLLWVNRIYNNHRMRHGLPYYSLSQAVKQKVKSAVSYISSFEEELVKFARTCKCDWVETLSALKEDENGNWDIVRYDEMLVDEHIANVSAAS